MAMNSDTTDPVASGNSVSGQVDQHNLSPIETANDRQFLEPVQDTPSTNELREIQAALKRLDNLMERTTIALEHKGVVTEKLENMVENLQVASERLLNVVMGIGANNRDVGRDMTGQMNAAVLLDAMEADSPFSLAAMLQLREEVRRQADENATLWGLHLKSLQSRMNLQQRYQFGYCVMFMMFIIAVMVALMAMWLSYFSAHRMN
ncbi:hypothetical protein F5Y17DRAFT_365595 [Xylariaceae sp. FL0594]|nr:hypothetical protein F5Y17DRAFT_365595 [Xylariaceae sp. FL0594]